MALKVAEKQNKIEREKNSTSPLLDHSGASRTFNVNKAMEKYINLYLENRIKIL